MWDCGVMEVCSSYCFEHVMLIDGMFLNNNEKFYLLNKYAPSDGVLKQLLWVTFSARIRASVRNNICMCGGF